MKAWPTVKLGEVLRHRKEFITIDDLTNYKRRRVQLHVQGIAQIHEARTLRHQSGGDGREHDDGDAEQPRLGVARIQRRPKQRERDATASSAREARRSGRRFHCVRGWL